MADPINEFGNLPIISAAPMALQNAVTGGGSADIAPAPVEPYDVPYAEPVSDDSIAVGSPYHEHDSACITVYPESITPSGAYDEKSPVCSFDIVFSVGIREGDVSKTYRVVKRIGVDKCKLACDAECSTPISVVEDKTKAQQTAALVTAKRFRVLAGLE